jgi:hypothetical protein
LGLFYFMIDLVGEIGGGIRPLSWSRTVPREMVHRASVAEVLLTDVREMGDGRFTAAACWPRSHPTFPRGGADLHSPLILVETLRQLGIYVPLRYFGVPPTSFLLISDLFFEMDTSAEPRAPYGATQVMCPLRVSEIRRGPDGAVTGLRLDMEFQAEGKTFARAGGGARFLDAVRYTSLRAEQLPADVRATPAASGRDDGHRPDHRTLGVATALDVVVAHCVRGQDAQRVQARDAHGAKAQGGGGHDADGHAGGAGVALLVSPADPRHPFFFDHATDHIPGMVLLEAARQAAALRSGGTLLRPTAGRLKAARFTEFDPPAHVQCVPHATTCVFRILQGGEQKAFGVLRYA